MIRVLILSFFAFFSYLSSLSASTIMIMGDSISAGYGMNIDDAWPSIAARKLGARHVVINASISGDTSAGGLSRLQEGLNRHQPDIVIIELGGNDGLRGLSLEHLKQSLIMIAQQSLDSGAIVLICGMQMPPNYGPIYANAFENTYYDVAQQLNITIIPKFIEAVALSPEMMQSDGIHPNKRGHENLAFLILPYVTEALNHVANR
jgi:acyl-CoA thioesterase I